MRQKKDVAESCLKTLTAIYMLKPWIGRRNRDAPLYLEVNIEFTPDVLYSTLLYSVYYVVHACDVYEGKFIHIQIYEEIVLMSMRNHVGRRWP